MPALQSYWFIPHVNVYLMGYAMLSISSLSAIVGLILWYSKKYNPVFLEMADRCAYLGFTFITFGILFGAMWAKEAWGHYWTWDPKETWAFLTWMSYLLYIHVRLRYKESVKTPLWVLAMALVVLLICWYGVNYLPSAQNSVHTYSNQS